MACSLFGLLSLFFFFSVKALRAEVKNLKDANRALTLYTSKILDRILSMDGYEGNNCSQSSLICGAETKTDHDHPLCFNDSLDILSADHGNSLQASVRRMTGTKSRKSLRDLSTLITSPQDDPGLLSVPTIAAPKKGHRTTKSVSTINPAHLVSYFSGIASPEPKPDYPSSSTPVPLASEAATSSSVKPKRTRPASIDWKGGFASFFSPTSSPVVPSTALPESRLKPLHLSASTGTSPPRPGAERASTVDSPSISSYKFPTMTGRKVSSREEFEDEEDRLQRERYVSEDLNLRCILETTNN